MKRFAFTMMELVFVIIIIGILAVLAMPSFTSNPLQHAAEQVASHIRYAQHLAMVNDIFDEGEQNWHLARAQISFRACNDGRSYYFIGNDIDRNGGHIAETEAAINPLNGKRMYWLNTQCQENTYPTRDPSLLLTDQYGITLNSNCGGTISFDNMGRPYNVFAATPIMGQLANDCNITLLHPTDGNVTIIIRPETGHVSIVYN